MGAFLLLLIAAAAVVQAKHFPVLVTGDEASAAWKRVGRAQNQMISFEVNWEYQNTDLLDEKFLAVSDFRSPHYGKYLTTAQVSAMLAPTLEEKKPVLEWLR